MPITEAQLKAAIGGNLVSLDKLAAALNLSFVGTNGAALQIRGGTIALDGANPTPVTTGLSAVTAAFVQENSAVAPGLTASVFSWAATGGTLNIYAWQPTGAGDTTLVASNDTGTVSWIAIGT